MSATNELVARLEIEPIRKAFPHEAMHFTTWLESQIEALAERLGIELTVIEREKSVGDFNVDLLCEDGNGKSVIIENQLERTDHDHLGKLLTYLVNLDASTAIWITTDPRPEHQKVIDWLNESTAADLSFYLVKVEAIRIANSPFAPLFTVLAAPDNQVRKIGEKKKELAARQSNHFEFWKSLLERSKTKTKLFAHRTPGHHHWLGIGAGKTGCGFHYVVTNDGASIELYIDYDKDTGEKNKAIFDALHAQREDIEKEFGGPLEWERLDDKRASRIRKYFTEGGRATPEKWPELQERMIDGMIRLDRALRQRLARIET
jgi:Domain of unknown function (DUF4268)